ncbi:MAG: hypothetical protein KJ967_00680, partial [Elusimicrobia bacterium]|nr:hypothetical protein [Elusimicrobiota bacterium]
MKKILLNTIFIVLLCPLCFSGNVFGWSTRTYTTDADFSGFSRDGVEITGSDTAAQLNLTRNWQEITPAGGSPQARHSAAVSWDVALSSCLVHGGNTGTDHLIDLWLYNSKDNTWLQRAPSPRPSARYGHKVVNISTGIFLLFGGLDSAGTYHNDAWFYDQHKNTYAQKYYGVTPSSRAYFSMEYLPEYRRVYLFGGTNGSSIFNDLWYYDVAADSWSFVLVESSPPVRYGHGMCWVNPSSCAVVYAGQGNSGLLSDLWSFNVSSGAWQNYPQTQPIKPSARTDFAFLYLKEIARIFLFGGYTGGSPSMSNETWLYNFNTNQWS